MPPVVAGGTVDESRILRCGAINKKRHVQHTWQASREKGVAVAPPVVAGVVVADTPGAAWYGCASGAAAGVAGPAAACGCGRRPNSGALGRVPARAERLSLMHEPPPRCRNLVWELNAGQMP